MKILIFEPNWVGDVIFTTPSFKAIKEKISPCFIGVIVPKRCSELLKYHPFVDEIIEFNEREEDRSLKSKISLIKKLKSKKYDMVILFHRSFTRTLLCFLGGIKERIGYAFKKRAFLLTKKIPPLDKDSLHKQDYYLKILEAIGIKIKDKNCQVYISEKEKKWAEKIIKEVISKKKYLIGLNLITNWKPKNWPLSYFKELINILKEELKEVKFFLTSKNKINCEEFFKEHKDYIVNLTGKTTLLQLCALYEKMDLIISADSGPLHLAGALNKKYIGIYGPTNPYLTEPRSKAKGKIIFKNDFCTTPCYIKKCPKDFLCIKIITPEEVSKTVLELINI
jgi:lipopolysaccharide heptosyltransferase II